MRQSLRLSFFGMKDEFGFLRRQILLFDRTKLGRVPRQVFWLTMAVYAAIYSAAFAVPFEVGFRLEVEPDSSYMKIFLNGWLVFFFFSIAPVVRLTRRRLHDAGLSGWWMLLGVVPVVGWAVVCVLLCLPSAPLGKYDRFVEENRKKLRAFATDESFAAIH